MNVPYPFNELRDSSNQPVTGVTVTIAQILRVSDLQALALDLVTVNGVNGGNVLADSKVAVTYDAEVNGDAWITLAVSKEGVTFQDPTPYIFASKDPSRIQTALPNVAPGAAGGMPTGDGSGRVVVATVAANALNAAALAADAVTEIQAGLATNTALATVATNIGTGFTSIANNLSAITAQITRLLGLAQENAVTEAVYRTDKQIQSSVTYCYDTAEHLEDNDHTTGLIAQYELATVYEGAVLKEYRVKRVL